MQLCSPGIKDARRAGVKDASSTEISRKARELRLRYDVQTPILG